VAAVDQAPPLDGDGVMARRQSCRAVRPVGRPSRQAEHDGRADADADVAALGSRDRPRPPARHGARCCAPIGAGPGRRVPRGPDGPPAVAPAKSERGTSRSQGPGRLVGARLRRPLAGACAPSGWANRRWPSSTWTERLPGPKREALAPNRGQPARIPWPLPVDRLGTGWRDGNFGRRCAHHRNDG